MTQTNDTNQAALGQRKNSVNEVVKRICVLIALSDG